MTPVEADSTPVLEFKSLAKVKTGDILLQSSEGKYLVVGQVIGFTESTIAGLPGLILREPFGTSEFNYRLKDGFTLYPFVSSRIFLTGIQATGLTWSDAVQRMGRR